MFPSLIIAAALCGQLEVAVETLEGARHTGALTELTEGQVTVTTSDGPRTVAAEQLLAIRPKNGPTAEAVPVAARVWLTDGSLLPASAYVVADGVASVATVGGPSLKIPTAHIAEVRFYSRDSGLDAKFDAIADRELTGDTLVVRRKDETGKTVALDFLEGVLGDVSQERVRFDFDGDVINVQRAKLAGLLYYHPPSDEPANVACLVETADGTRVAARRVTLHGEQLALSIAGGGSLGIPLGAVVNLDFSGGKVRYLSDMEPLAWRYTPYIESPTAQDALARLFAPRRNQGFDGGPLTLRTSADSGPVAYAKGLAVCSKTTLEYAAPKGYARLRAVVGMDGEARELGAVRLEIYGDSRRLFAEEICSGDEPVPLDLDVAGFERIRIVVDYGTNLDIADQVLLCQLRLTK